jgi:hypothetical protein
MGNIVRTSNFFDRIYRIDWIETFYRIERRKKIARSMNPILKILFILSKNEHGDEYTRSAPKCPNVIGRDLGPGTWDLQHWSLRDGRDPRDLRDQAV